MTSILDSLGAFYESLSTAQVIIIVILLIMIIICLVLYLMYRYIRNRIEKRLRLGKRIASFAVEKLSEKTKDSKLRQKTEETVRGVIGDSAVEAISNSLKPDDDANIKRDIHELLEEMGEESFLFSIIAFFYKRKFKKEIERDESLKKLAETKSKDIISPDNQR